MIEPTPSRSPSLLPSTPAADADLGPRWWSGYVRAALKQHLTRAGAVAGAVLMIGAIASVYLSEVGVETCTADGRCTHYRFYPFTAQLRSAVQSSKTPAGDEHYVWRREWYPSGGMWIEGRYIDGERSGDWREHWPDGTLRFEGTYKNGALGGVETWYYANGQKEWQVGRLAGRRDGEERWWHENGELRRVGSYRSGEKHGSFTVFDENGELAFTGEYRNGEVVAGKRVD